MSFQNQISLNTKGHGDMKDITEQVAAAVKSSGIKTGIANVFNMAAQRRSVRLNSSQDCNVICRQFWTS
jgi:thiamine phosphate synthase YjbQ (UPF0047 family)